MSVCIRTISNKLSLPFVGTGKPVSPVDRQLTRNVKKTTTAFLEEFFGSGSTTVRGETRESVGTVGTARCTVKSLERTSDNVVAWNYKLDASENGSVRNGERRRKEDIAARHLREVSMRNVPKTMFSVVEKTKEAQSVEETDRKSGEESTPSGKPSQEQLNHVYQVLRNDLPAFFIKSVDYSIYHPFVEFENNIKGTVTKGIYEYVKQTAMLRIVGHLKFAYVKFEVLKMTVHTEDDSVKVRWRIRGITGTNIFLTFWKHKLWNIQETIDVLDSWHDGFSTFYVNSDGKVVKHVADKMMPDQDTEVTTKNKSGMAAKLALFLGLMTPREFLADISPLVSCGAKLDPTHREKRPGTPLDQIK